MSVHAKVAWLPKQVLRSHDTIMHAGLRRWVRRALETLLEVRQAEASRPRLCLRKLRREWEHWWWLLNRLLWLSEMLRMRTSWLLRKAADLFHWCLWYLRIDLLLPVTLQH